MGIDLNVSDVIAAAVLSFSIFHLLTARAVSEADQELREGRAS